MREAVFIKQNISKWREYEYLMTAIEAQSPDELADMYNDLTADLAFAQTHYPNSRITQYLNNITLQLHTGSGMPDGSCSCRWRCFCSSSPSACSRR